MEYKQYTTRILQFLGFSSDDYDVVADSLGTKEARIVSWKAEAPQPTEQELLDGWNKMNSEAVVLAKKKEAKQGSLSSDTYLKIIDKYPLYRQLNIFNLMEGYTQADLDEMKAFINEQRQKQKELEEKILNCTTLKELEDLAL